MFGRFASSWSTRFFFLPPLCVFSFISLEKHGDEVPFKIRIKAISLPTHLEIQHDMDDKVIQTEKKKQRKIAESHQMDISASLVNFIDQRNNKKMRARIPCCSSDVPVHCVLALVNMDALLTYVVVLLVVDTLTTPKPHIRATHRRGWVNVCVHGDNVRHQWQQQQQQQR